MAGKKKKKKLLTKKIQKGSIGNFFVFGLLALLIILGIAAVDGLPSQLAPNSGQIVNIISPTSGKTYNNLQLKTFGYVTLAPTLTPSKLCKSKAINTEPEILAAYFPGLGQTVSNAGQIKVWVNDEAPPYIAPGEVVNTSNSPTAAGVPPGGVITPGNRTVKAKDGYLWEPALYVGTPVESGGIPSFPNYIKGDFNNNPPHGGGIRGATMDPVPQGTKLSENFTAEDIWDVSKLGLTPGTYPAEFVIHDGDTDRGIGCVTIQIQ